MSALILIPTVGHSQALPQTSTFHPDASYDAESLLRNAARQVAAKQWPEAIDLYLRVIEQHGDSVAQVPESDPAADPTGSSVLYVNARRYCQQAISALPPEGLAAYRQRVDARAEALLQEARSTGDVAIARRLVDEMFASRWGDQGLELLGDLEFRAGRFRDALAAYYRLVPDPNAAPTFRFPDPDVDTTRIAAKILLVRAANGVTPAAAEIEGFRRAFAELKSPFAGRDSALPDALEGAISDDDWRPPPPPPVGWPTLAGAPTRNRVVAEKVDVGSFQWKLELPAIEQARPAPEPEDFRGFGNSFRPRAAFDSEPSTFPIIMDDLVIISDESKVEAYPLEVRSQLDSEGAVAKPALRWRSEFKPQFSVSENSRGYAGQAVPRFALTAVGDLVFARLGAAGRGTSGGILFAIRSNKEVEGKIIWRKQASEIALPVARGGEPRVASFEGAPVADANHVYIALTEATTDTWAFVACLDAQTGETVWVRHLGSCAPKFDAARNLPVSPAIGNRMLSLANGRIFYQMNMGAVACLEAESGAVRWVATYPVPERGAQINTKRSPNPALIAEGLIIVAPEDAPGLFAFDAETGRLAWKTTPASDLKHLLGVSGGKLFATGNHLYTFDVQTGRAIRVWPESGARFDGYGRGVLAGGFVYWPTRTEILVIDQATGGDVHESIPLFKSFGYEGGNLALGDGYLVVAERERVSVYCQNRRLLERIRTQLAGSPQRALDHFQLARLAEAAGEFDVALASLDEALAGAKPEDRVDAQPLATAAQERRQQLLIRLGDELGKQGDWTGAIARFQQARTSANSPRQRLSALSKLARAHEAVPQPDAALLVYQSILNAPELGGVVVVADAQRQVRADIWAADRVAALIEANGRTIYANQDTEADALLERGQRDRDLETLRVIVASYPNSRAVVDALWILADLTLATGDADAGANALEHLVVIAKDDAMRARALLRLAGLQEGRGEFSLARATYDRLMEFDAGLTLSAGGPPLPIREIIAPRLERIRARGSAAEPPSASTNGPLGDEISGEWDFDARPFWLEAGDGDPILLVADGTRVHLWDFARSKPQWTVDAGAEPVWVDIHNSNVLVGAGDRIAAINRVTGEISWRFDPWNPDAGAQKLSPFSRVDASPIPLDDGAEARSEQLVHGFQRVGPRLSMLRGDSTLLTIDLADGRLLWSYAVAPAAAGASSRSAFNPRWLVTQFAIVVEELPANRLLILDSMNGTLIGQLDRGHDTSPLGRAPAAIDGKRFALALDGRTVGLYDLAKGRLAWTYHDTAALPRAMPPALWTTPKSAVALFGGQSLARLDLGSGESMWTQVVGPTDLSDQLDAIALDDERVYCAWGSRCDAFRLADGERVWRQPLESAEVAQAVALCGPWLAVAPSASAVAEKGLAAVGVTLHRRESGAIIQRIDFDEPAEVFASRFGDFGAFIATQSRAWVLERKRGEVNPR